MFMTNLCSVPRMEMEMQFSNKLRIKIATATQYTVRTSSKIHLKYFYTVNIFKCFQRKRSLQR